MKDFKRLRGHKTLEKIKKKGLKESEKIALSIKLLQKGATINEVLDVIRLAEAIKSYYDQYLKDGFQLGSDLTGILPVVGTAQTAIEGGEEFFNQLDIATKEAISEIASEISNTLFQGSEKAYWISMSVLSIYKVFRG